MLDDEARRLGNVAVIERFSRRRYGSSASADGIVETLRTEREAKDDALGVPDGEHQ